MLATHLQGFIDHMKVFKTLNEAVTRDGDRGVGPRASNLLQGFERFLCQNVEGARKRGEAVRGVAPF